MLHLNRLERLAKAEHWPLGPILKLPRNVNTTPDVIFHSIVVQYVMYYWTRPATNKKDTHLPGQDQREPTDKLRLRMNCRQDLNIVERLPKMEKNRLSYLFIQEK